MRSGQHRRRANQFAAAQKDHIARRINPDDRDHPRPRTRSAPCRPESPGSPPPRPPRPAPPAPPPRQPRQRASSSPSPPVIPSTHTHQRPPARHYQPDQHSNSRNSFLVRHPPSAATPCQPKSHPRCPAHRSPGRPFRRSTPPPRRARAARPQRHTPRQTHALLSAPDPPGADPARLPGREPPTSPTAPSCATAPLPPHGPILANPASRPRQWGNGGAVAPGHRPPSKARQAAPARSGAPSRGRLASAPDHRAARSGPSRTAARQAPNPANADTKPPPNLREVERDVPTPPPEGAVTQAPADRPRHAGQHALAVLRPRQQRPRPIPLNASRRQSHCGNHSNIPERFPAADSDATLHTSATPGCLLEASSRRSGEQRRASGSSSFGG